MRLLLTALFLMPGCTIVVKTDPTPTETPIPDVNTGETGHTGADATPVPTPQATATPTATPPPVIGPSSGTGPTGEPVQTGSTGDTGR